MKVFTNNNRLHFFFRSLLLFASLLHFGSFSLTKTYKIDMYMSVARRSMGVCLCRKSRCARRRRQRRRRHRRQDSSMWYRWPLSLGEQASARMIGVCAGRCDNRQTALRYRSSFFFGWLAAAHTAFLVVGSHIHFFFFLSVAYARARLLSWSLDRCCCALCLRICQLLEIFRWVVRARAPAKFAYILVGPLVHRVSLSRSAHAVRSGFSIQSNGLQTIESGV